MQVLVDNSLVGGCDCPNCKRWKDVTLLTSSVHWDSGVPFRSDTFKCLSCAYVWISGKWKVPASEIR